LKKDKNKLRESIARLESELALAKSENNQQAVKTIERILKRFREDLKN